MMAIAARMVRVTLFEEVPESPLPGGPSGVTVLWRGVHAPHRASIR